MNITLITASSRPDSQSARICARINQMYFSSSASVVDLCTDELPVWNGAGFKDERVTSMRTKLRDADAFVLVIPEWNGMAPAAVKNLFLWCGAREFAHKPALLVAVSSGNGGAFIINEMRTSGYKNSRLLYLPEHLILRDVEQLWLEGEDREEADAKTDQYLQRRMAYALNILTTYAESLMPVRASLLEGLADFPNGMS